MFFSLYLPNEFEMISFMKSPLNKIEIIQYLELLLKEQTSKKELLIIGRTLKNFTKDDWSAITASFTNRDLKNISANIINILNVRIPTLVRNIPKGFRVEQRTKEFNPNFIMGALFGRFNNLDAPEDKAQYLIKTALKSGLYLFSAKKGFSYQMMARSSAPLFAMAIISTASNRILEHIRYRLEQEYKNLNQASSDEALLEKEDIHKTILFLEKLISVLNITNSGIATGLMIKLFSRFSSSASLREGLTTNFFSRMPLIEDLITTTLLSLFSNDISANKETKKESQYRH